MPGRDGTGPLGQGALTGRGLGVSRTGNNFYGRGMGLGLGFGRFNYCRRAYNPSLTNASLTEQKAILEARLEEINKQLNKQ
jgi:hypothetical protein